VSKHGLSLLLPVTASVVIVIPVALSDFDFASYYARQLPSDSFKKSIDSLLALRTNDLETSKTHLSSIIVVGGTLERVTERLLSKLLSLGERPAVASVLESQLEINKNTDHTSLSCWHEGITLIVVS
jgi:hypothetical protein